MVQRNELEGSMAEEFTTEEIRLFRYTSNDILGNPEEYQSQERQQAKSRAKTISKWAIVKMVRCKEKQKLKCKEQNCGITLQ